MDRRWYDVFTEDNSSGYSEVEREQLNNEYRKRWQGGEWLAATPNEAKQWFADEVARR